MSWELHAILRRPVPSIRRFQSAARFSRSSTETSSLATSDDKVLWQFDELGEVLQVDLLGVRRVREAILAGGDLGAALPVPDLDTVLRRLVHLLGSDDIAAGIGLITVRDPHLPIDVLGAKREMIAFGAANHAAAEVLH